MAMSLGMGQADASEVVKLARLVVTGKRSLPESAKTASDTRSGEHQGHGGGSDDHGTAPAPSRGVS
jgi:hypothetical protein